MGGKPLVREVIWIANKIVSLSGLRVLYWPSFPPGLFSLSCWFLISLLLNLGNPQVSVLNLFYFITKLEGLIQARGFKWLHLHPDSQNKLKPSISTWKFNRNHYLDSTAWLETPFLSHLSPDSGSPRGGSSPKAQDHAYRVFKPQFLDQPCDFSPAHPHPRSPGGALLRLNLVLFIRLDLVYCIDGEAHQWGFKILFNNQNP